ncbi:hypothetical protein CLOM_g11483 [Closterium sp. NIES-68]|nr:hypothetical protein CLOM_g11483 [Closterium sp. NIES-68]
MAPSAHHGMPDRQSFQDHPPPSSRPQFPGQHEQHNLPHIPPPRHNPNYNPFPHFPKPSGPGRQGFSEPSGPGRQGFSGPPGLGRQEFFERGGEERHGFSEPPSRGMAAGLNEPMPPPQVRWQGGPVEDPGHQLLLQRQLQQQQQWQWLQRPSKRGEGRTEGIEAPLDEGRGSMSDENWHGSCSCGSSSSSSSSSDGSGCSIPASEERTEAAEAPLDKGRGSMSDQK